MAEPPPSVIDTLQPGDQIPMTTPAMATPNAAGLVNLLAIPASPIWNCNSYYVKDLGSQWVNVGQAYTTGDGINLAYNLMKGSSTTVEIGVSPTGLPGTFSVGGSISVGVNDTVGYPEYHDSAFVHYQTRFDRYLSYVDCTGDGAPPRKYYVSWEAGSLPPTPFSCPVRRTPRTVPQTTSARAATTFTRQSTQLPSRSAGATGTSASQRRPDTPILPACTSTGT